MKFSAKVWVPESGSDVSKEVAGPSSFEEWRRSWRVYGFALMFPGDGRRTQHAARRTLRA